VLLGYPHWVKAKTKTITKKLQSGTEPRFIGLNRRVTGYEFKADFLIFTQGDWA